ncbi:MULTISPECIES: hypothetical protein [unclassified Fibrobacter]|uniref:hypothetical protein n=1 Tax=unclassified Fibrobacter TaxID=2634177 RepID=UPI000D6A863D|nr:MULTISPECIES: hypothetical protein [unclassified Fibrobacter]PWJ68346.1 hypothetical protein BGX12_10872 [Fibrobacter sp. UWR4]PZW68120.1 hypothetical protein C8E88_102027 [Fibrobacter sp. UWR1]
MNRKKKMRALLPHPVHFEKLEMFGGNYVGDPTLLTLPWSRIGVFASRSEDPAIGFLREQWAMSKGRKRCCVIGTFHSQGECEILYHVLKFGGSAVWLMGCSLPAELSNFCKDAIRKGRLLIVSCFNREQHTYATARYCAHLADMYSSRLAIWSMKEGSMIQPIYNRAKANGKMVEVF